MASSILTPHKSCNLIPPMNGTRQNWNLVCKWGPYDNHTQPRTNPRPQGGLVLIQGQMRPPQGHQQPPRRTPILKPSSNSSLALALITGSATSPSCQYLFRFCYSKFWKLDFKICSDAWLVCLFLYLSGKVKGLTILHIFCINRAFLKSVNAVVLIQCNLYKTFFFSIL